MNTIRLALLPLSLLAAVAATGQEPSAAWSDTRTLVQQRCREIAAWSGEVETVLNGFRAAPEFERHEQLWTAYLDAYGALQSARDEGADDQTQAPLQQAVRNAQTALQDVIGASPHLRTLSVLLAQGKQLAAAQPPARTALREVNRILREAKLTDDNVSDLKSERAALATRIESAKRLVATQQDAKVKEKNLSLIAQAEQKLGEMDRSLARLAALAATHHQRIQQLAPAADDQAVGRLRQQAADLRGEWNDAQLRLQDAQAAISQFTEPRTMSTVIGLQGTATVRRLDGSVVPASAALQLLPGEEIRVAAGSHAMVEFEDGSRVAVGSNATFRYEPTRGASRLGALDVKQGMIRYRNSFHRGGVPGVVRDLERDAAKLRMRQLRGTGTFAQTIRGCDVLVQVQEGRLRVYVAEGELVLHQHADRIVAAGHDVVLFENGDEPIVRPLDATAYRRLLAETFPDVE